MHRRWIKNFRCALFLLVSGVLLMAGSPALTQETASAPTNKGFFDIYSTAGGLGEPFVRHAAGMYSIGAYDFPLHDAPFAETATNNQSIAAAPGKEGAYVFYPVVGVAAAEAQQSDAAPDRGVYGHVVFGGGHDSLSGYSGEMELSVGYDFSHSLEVEAGVPIYWLSTARNVNDTAVSGFSNRYGSLGDVSLKLEFSPDIDPFDYTATVTGTLPTGSTNTSAGRGTWDWNNRFQHDLWRPFNPFGEIVLGNVLPVATRPVALPGVISQFRAGNTFKLQKSITFDALFYEAVPISGQIPSTNVKVTPLARTIQLSDHGFMGSVMASHSRWDFEVGYQRSISNRLDTFWAAIGFRIGHVRKESTD